MVLWIVGYLKCFRCQLCIERINVRHVNGIVEDNDAIFMQKRCAFSNYLLGCDAALPDIFRYLNRMY